MATGYLTVKPHRALFLAFVLASATAVSAQPVPTPSPAASASPSAAVASPAAQPSAPVNASPQASGSPLEPDAVVGQVLAVAGGFLVFTTGDAVRLAPGLNVPPNFRLGVTVRAKLDPATRTITAVTSAAQAEPGDIDAVHLPRAYAVASPASLRTPAPAPDVSGGSGAHGVTLSIDLRVPGSTPLTDDVYLATDRTNFNPSEIRMQRVDAQRFSTTLQLPVGTQLRYEFSRGSFATIERDKLGGIVTPREINLKADITVHDSVAGWADIN
jgi:hypothetical protein